MGYNLLINGVYWRYNLLTTHLLTSWDIQVCLSIQDLQRLPLQSDPNSTAPQKALAHPICALSVSASFDLIITPIK